MWLSRRGRLVIFLVLLTMTLAWLIWSTLRYSYASQVVLENIQAKVQQTNNRPTVSVGSNRLEFPTVATFELEYTPVLTLERTASVTLLYARGREALDILEGPNARKIQFYPTNDIEFKVTLDAPDFGMQDGRETKTPKVGARLPTAFGWVLAPQKPGTFTVALDVSELMEAAQWNKGDILRTSVTQRGNAINLQDRRCCQILFPI